MVIAAVCFGIVCQVKSCAQRVREAAREVAGLPRSFSLLGPKARQTEPQKPSIVPPGQSAPPGASRRPVFGTEKSEGTEITTENTESTKVFVRKDGTVVNLGSDTLVMRVTKVGPAWVEWDPSVGVCAFVSKDREEWKPVARRGGYALDVSGKLKLMDFRPLYGLQIGIPTLYATTGGFGAGLDVKLTGLEWLALDAIWLPAVKRVAVGLSLDLP